MDPEEFYRTNDMAMATYLKLEGHPCQGLVWNRNVCFWLFRVTDALLDATEDFLDRKARIEPRAYSKEFDVTRQEFFDSKENRRA